MSAAFAVRCVAEGFSFLEGARWHNGRLYVSDFYTHRVLSFDSAGTMETVCNVPGQPSGLGFAPDGSLRVVSMLDRRLMRFDGGQLTPVADLKPFAPNDCNDMLVDSQGRAYVGNFGVLSPGILPTRLLLVRPDGAVSVAAEDLVFPNGVVISPEGRTLFVAETFAARVSAFCVASDGSLLNRRTWASFAPSSFETINDALNSGVTLPDGMALDAEGALWMGDAGGRGPVRVEKGGRILQRVDTGDLSVFAVALGGADRRTLYMCASPPLLANIDPEKHYRSCLLECRVDVPGTGLP